MSETDRIKWDERYAKGLGSLEPAPMVKRYSHLAPAGKALDIACGNGRNSLYLAENGFLVDAVDISAVAIGQLDGRHANITTMCVDLDTWSIPADRYDLIVNIRFLDRRLFPMIETGLKPGGVVVFEAFLDDADSRYCLRHNELLHEFWSLRVVYYEEIQLDRSEKFDQAARCVGIKPSVE